MGKQYKEITCKSAMHQIKSKMPYEWDLNIYRGCAHACQYCFALYSHRYLEEDNFFDTIYVKTNIVEQFERELASSRWKRAVVNIGGITDSYQPAEDKYQIMPDILRLLIQYQTPAIISTKSDLILRDYDLIDELSRTTYVNIAATITTMNEPLRRILEPGGVASKRRFEVLKAFRKTNASVGVHVMPIIPYLTDTPENLEALYANARECDVHYLLPGTLHLRSQTRTCFFHFLNRHYPELRQRFIALYPRAGLSRDYKLALRQLIRRLQVQYGISSNYNRVMKEKMPHPNQEWEQLSFFQ